MTTISIDLTRAPAPIGATALATDARVETAWAVLELVEGTSTIRTLAASAWTLVNGVGTIEAEPTPETNALRIRVVSGLPDRPEWYVQVPESGTVNLSDLVRVDPRDLSPLPPLTPAFLGALASEKAEREAADELLQFNIDEGIGAPTDAGLASLINTDGTASQSAVIAQNDAAIEGRALATSIAPSFADANGWATAYPSSGAVVVGAGSVAITYTAGDIASTADTGQNLRLHPIPTEGAWTCEVDMTHAMTTAGQKAGLLLYRDQTTYAGLIYERRSGAPMWRRFNVERSNALRSQTIDGITQDYTSTTASSLPATVRLRLVCDGETVRASDSLDGGLTWNRVGRPAPVEMFNHIGVWAGGAAVAAAATFSNWTFTGAAPTVVAGPKNEGKPFAAASNAVTLGLPTDTLSTRFRDILRNANKYTLGTWIPATYGGQGVVDYWTLVAPGTGENQVRPPATAAFALATQLFTRTWDAAAIGVTAATGLATAVKLVASVAKAHKANTPGATGWGDNGQAPAWAYNAGQAAWMLWEHLTVQQREWARRMVLSEAAWAPYGVQNNQVWKYPDGTPNPDRVGDSPGETIAWSSNIFALASCMMPTHRRAGFWDQTCVDFSVRAFAIQADCTDDTHIINGSNPADYAWQGFNTNSDGTFVNHGIVHPDYIASAKLLLQNATIYPLSSRKTPKAVLHNAALMYSALLDVDFDTGEGFNAPGGKMYPEASKTATGDPGAANGLGYVYYPQGADWGFSRRMNFAGLDAAVDAFGLHPDANTWGLVHAQAALDMQARGSTGQTYYSGDVDTYANREQWVAQAAANGYLARFVTFNAMYRVTNAPAGAF